VILRFARIEEETPMSQSSEVSRREFIRRSAATGAGGIAVPYLVSSSALGGQGKPGANEKLAIALIGCGGMGRGNLANCARYPDVAVVGACDVWKARRDATVAAFKRTAKPYSDYREVLAHKGIDGVIIATPPHWHALISIDAAEAGKDFYVQKPMTIHLDESLAVHRAAVAHKVITQVGTQIHAGGNYRRVVEWVRSGKLGPITVARTFLAGNQGETGLGNVPNSAPPPGIDWNFWVGPAPMRPFNPMIVANASTNCSFMAYSGGYTPGMAPHIIDLPFWALELGIPPRTSCSGGRYVTHDCGDAYDTQQVLWEYPKFTMTWMLQLCNSYGFDFQGPTNAITRRLGVYFHGVDGTLYADYGTHKLVPEGNRMKDTRPPQPSIPSSPGQEREWLDALRSRKQPSCNVSYHYKLDAAIGLANIAYSLGRSVRFDPKTEKIVDDPEAAGLARPVYRQPWKFPVKYLEG
jgi:predicted dehydrogenase